MRLHPLFNEGLVAIADKDRYGRTSPASDKVLFRKYAESPELAHLINVLVFGGSGPAIENNRTDIAGIYIPDLIKCDLSTGPCRLAGGDASHPTTRASRAWASSAVTRSTARFRTRPATAGSSPAAGRMAAASATTWWTLR
jgi:hypothetical protein